MDPCEDASGGTFNGGNGGDTINLPSNSYPDDQSPGSCFRPLVAARETFLRSPSNCARKQIRV